MVTTAGVFFFWCRPTPVEKIDDERAERGLRGVVENVIHAPRVDHLEEVEMGGVVDGLASSVPLNLVGEHPCNNVRSMDRHPSSQHWVRYYIDDLYLPKGMICYLENASRLNGRREPSGFGPCA